jgi:hypothetical protein
MPTEAQTQAQLPGAAASSNIPNISNTQVATKERASAWPSAQPSASGSYFELSSLLYLKSSNAN